MTEKAIGNYTLIFNEGIVAFLNGRVYHTTWRYNNIGSSRKPIYESDCTQTLIGWSHSTTEDGNLVNPEEDSWNCFFASRIDEPEWIEDHYELANQDLVDSEGNPIQASGGPVVHDERTESSGLGHLLLSDEDQHNVEEQSFSVDEEELFKFLDTPIEEMGDDEETLPSNWDWREINGVAFTSSPPDQGGCGSCYIHAAVGMAESRIRVASKGKLNPALSVQHIVDCNFHTEGCNGGYEGTVALFAWEFGFRNRECYEGQKKPSPQKEKDLRDIEYTSCSSKCDDEENYGVSQFGIVGGAYGSTTELKMMKEIRARGPISIAYEATEDFMSYKEGVFKKNFDPKDGINVQTIHHPADVLAELHREPISDKNIFDLGLEWTTVNHAILVVGWGETCHEDGSCTKYWVCENSWGNKWAKEDGFFYMLRGVDLDSMESFATFLNPRIPESMYNEEASSENEDGEQSE